MPISYIYGPATVNATDGDEIILSAQTSAGVSNTVNAAGGDDLILGDTRSFFNPVSNTHNNSIGTAVNLTSITSWSTEENPFFEDDSIPHTSVYAQSTIGETEYYRVDVGAGETIAIDIDFSLGSQIGDVGDIFIQLLTIDGTILAQSTSSSISSGGLGSFSSFDSLIQYTAASAGNYYIRVLPYPGGDFTSVVNYVMNVSVTGHATGTASSAGSDVLNGGDGNDVIAGQAGDDTINGDAGDDILIGGSGVDTINGGLGNDTIYGGRGPGDTTGGAIVLDTVHGNEGNDIIHSSGEGYYYGDDGDDTIYAATTTGAGPESLDGGAGSDTLDLTTYVGDYVVNLFTGATNFLAESFTNFENVTSGIGDDTINGNNAANTIVTNAGDDTILGRGGNDVLNGGSGNNYINGGLGADQMIAGTGNDIFYVDDLGDSIIDSGGTDLVRTTLSYTLINGMENLQLLTANNLDATGNDLANIIWGNAGNNIIDGGLGADIMRGGNGDDTYIVDNIGDRAVEAPGQTGFDVVYSSVNFSLWDRVEQLVLTGTADINGYGNDGENTLFGNSGANILNGRAGDDSVFGNAGDDRLFGDAGDDVLQGGDGSDLLQGGAGRDFLTGGAGADGFIFADGDMGSSYATADRIFDFSQAEGDRIRLNLSDANSNVGGDQAYTFIGTSEFSHTAGELRYQQINGNTYIYGDQDGDGAIDWIVRVDGVHNLVAGDFIL